MKIAFKKFEDIYSPTSSNVSLHLTLPDLTIHLTLTDSDIHLTLTNSNIHLALTNSDIHRLNHQSPKIEMSLPTQNRVIYPSPKESLNSYMAAIRLASSVRNSMNPQKAGADTENSAPLADSYGRHHPNFPPQPPVKTANQGGREPGLILNQTASAHTVSNTTKPGFVNSQDGNSLPSHSGGTGIWHLVERYPLTAAADLYALAIDRSDALLESLKHGFPKQHNGYFPPSNPPMVTADVSVSADTTANAPTGVKPGTLEQHNGYFSPPEPPIGSTQRARQLLPSNCQLYVNYSDPVTTYYVCPETKPTIINPIHDVASRDFPTEGLSIFDRIETNNTDVCEAPTSVKEHLACADPNYLVALAIGLILSVLILRLIVQGCLVGCRKISRKFDEEAGITTRPKTWKDQILILMRKKPQDLTRTTTNNSEATLREPGASPNLSTTTNSSEATLIEQTRASLRGHRLDEGFSAEQYVPVAWRSRSYRAERARGRGRVVHDAGPVASLPGLRGEDRWLSHYERLA